MIYCEVCGAANNESGAHCFACQKPLMQTSISLDAAKLRADSKDEHMPSALREQYHVQALVGSGGFATVYKAIDRRANDRAVAIKEIKLRGLKPQEKIDATDTFNREIHFLSQLSHPHLPRIYHHFTDAEHWYLVMDFVDGQTLERYLLKQGGTLSLDETLSIGIQLCAVLQYLHEHQPPVIFRDLKPSNVMLDSHMQVYLVDFGTARFFKPGRLRDTIAFGSPGYAAPEQYGKAQTTPRSDLYSLGATLHHLLTGEDPSESAFQFAPLRTLKPHLPEVLEALIIQMLEMEPEKRPESASWVKEKLRRISAEQSRRLSALSNTTASSLTLVSSLPHPGQTPPAAWSTSTPTLQQAQMFLGLPVTPIPPSTRQRTAAKWKVSRRTAVIGIASLTLAGGALGLGLSQFAASNPWAVVPDSNSDLLTTGKTLMIHMHQSSINDLAWSPDKRRVASALLDGTVQVWDTHTGQTVSTFEKHGVPVNVVAWSPDGTEIASGGADRRVYIWQPESGEVIFEVPVAPGPTVAVAWSQRVKDLAVGASGVQVWDMGIRKMVARFDETEDVVTCLAWEPLNVARLAIGCADGTLHVWDNAFQYRYRRKSAVKDLCWSPGGRFIAVAYADNTIRVYQIAGRIIPIRYNDSHTAPVTSLSWAANGKWLASASLDQQVQVWEFATGNPLAWYRGHQDRVRAVSWAPESRILVSGGDDRTARIWYV
jgi:serine/threonine protein kinase